MSQTIPAIWASCEIGEIADVIGGATPPSKDITNFDESNGIPWITPADLSGYKSMYISRGARNLSEKGFAACSAAMLPSGAVLFSSRAPIGYVAIAANPVCTNQGFKSFALADGIDSRFVYFYLRFIKSLAEERATGTTFKELSGAAAARLPLTVAPTNEQKRIADKLDAVLARVDTCRDRLDRVPTILKRFRQAVLTAAASGKLTEEWRVMRGPNSETISHWKEIALGDLCESSFYGPRFGKNEYTQSNAGVPTIRTTDMTRDGRIEITKDTPKVIVPKDKVEHFRVQKGDLLVTRTGSIGVMAVFEDDYLAIPSAYLIRFRFAPQVLSRYVFYCLMAPAGQERLGLSATAITQPNVNAEAIKRIEVQLPSIDEQHEIVRRVEALFAYADRIDARYTAARAQVERLTPALLAKAFRGELVAQDPNDEPASVLLERLRASRAAAGEKPPRKARTERKPMTTTLTTG